MIKKFFISSIQKIIICVFLIYSSSASANISFTLKNTIFEKVGKQYNIDPLLLYSIALTESAIGSGKGYISPTPYVYRTSAGPRYFKNKKDAEQSLIEELKKTNQIDIGMMQINLRAHPQKQPLMLLDAEYNLNVAAKYLKTTLRSSKDSIIAVGRYHSWTKKLSTWYGDRVWKLYARLEKLNGKYKDI